MAVLSTRSEHRFVDLGCGWPISYCPAQAGYQRPGRAIFEVCPKARSRRFGAAVGPVGLPERIFWATAKASATASEERVARGWRWELARWASQSKFPGDGRSFRNSHGNPAPSLARAPLFWRWVWPVGLPETFWRWGVADGLAETSFQRRKAGGCWTPPRETWFQVYVATWAAQRTQPVAAMDVLSFRSDYMARSVDFGCGLPISHCPVQAVYQRPGRGRNPAGARRVPFFATRRIIEGLGLGLARRAARKLVPVVLTLGSGPSGFPRKHSARRPKLPRQPWQARAVVRALSVIVALGAGPSGFPKQFRGDGRSFRDSHGKPAPSFARAPLFWRWGLARRASRNNFPGDGQSICDSVPRARFRRFSAIAALGAGPSGFPKQFSGRRLKHLGSGRTGFPKQVSERCKAWDLGRRRGIRGPKPMSQHGPGLSRARTRAVAVLSTSGQMARILDSGCGWPISYCPDQGRPAYGRFINNGRFIKVEDQASGRNGRYITQKRANGRFHIVPHKQFINGQVNLFRKSWQSKWPLYQTGQPHSSFASSAAP